MGCVSIINSHSRFRIISRIITTQVIQQRENMIFNLAKKNTLIVEDFAEFARSVRAMLHSMGSTHANIVYNAEDAIEACKNHKYDIILSDYNLGSKKDGQQLLEELIKYKLIKSNCIFLMLTAENTSAMVMGAVEYQPDGYIAKPFNGGLLKARLQKAIEKKDTLHPILRSIANKNWREALENIEKILPEHPKYRMSCLRAKFQALKALNKLDEALKLVTEIISGRSIPWALEGAGEIYYLKKDFTKSMDIFKTMTKEFPIALEGYDWLAKLQIKLGQPIEAQETLIQAVEKSPKALKRQKNLGELAEVNNDIHTMTDAYRSAVKYGKNSAFSSPDEYIKLTTALTKQLSDDSDLISDKIINEAEQTFEKLKTNFSSTHSNLLRSNVAQASFYNACDETEKVEKHLLESKKHLAELDEQISANVSLEMSSTLSNLGKKELADEILNEAIQQNLDDPDFIKKAAKISDNKALIEMSLQANKFNLQAISLFKNKKYSDAISAFAEAHKLSPKNINIRLNYVQTLLKQAQGQANANQTIETADKLISEMPQLAFSDKRYPRYSELNRLTQLMLQQG